MKRLKLILSAPFVLIVGVELFARFVLGLGDPPLSIAHPTIEYMYAPNQSVSRFGNRMSINEYGMRSPPLISIGDVQRVLVFGDSIINGGSQTDQDELATSLASSDEVFFGNVSAGSWGPQNITAWIDEFGLLAADTAIYVFNSGDYLDIPTFDPLDPGTHPTSKPISATAEGLFRYLPRYFMDRSASNAGDARNPPKDTSRTILDFIDKTSDLKVCVIFVPALFEIERGPVPAGQKLIDLFETSGAPVVDLTNRLANDPDDLFRDPRHLNAAGQAVLAEVLLDCAQAAKHAN